MYIYSVFYYSISSIERTVYHLGYYANLDDAVKRLKTQMPNYKKWINKTVIQDDLIGWINKNVIGEDLITNLSASQPHSAVDLFEE